MAVTLFQFRVCQNPRCGLRYPLVDGNSIGERCPMCLGLTVAMADAAIEREPALHYRQPPASIGLEALLDNIRSASNVGSIFRSAEGFGLPHLYLCGITPTPDTAPVKKTALGAEDNVSWSSHRNAVVLVAELKAQGRRVWGLERTQDSVPLVSALPDGRVPDGLVFVVGNEQAGVDPGILSLVDKTIHVDMRGSKRSFNVAVAFAVAAYALIRA